ncbi:MAG TPA: flagellar FlbD family protein [Acidimicrobiales bacterium]|nr:flagellar FlbD family protein [Acidimicrobiales bacterium]
MISLTRFNSGERIAINPDLIERIEEIPDTVVTMANGNRHVIAESIDEITDKVRAFRASQLTFAMKMADHPSVAGTARLHVIRGAGGGDDIAGTIESKAVKP